MEPALCQLYRHTFVPYYTQCDSDVILFHIYASSFFDAMLYVKRREIFVTVILHALLKHALLIS